MHGRVPRPVVAQRGNLLSVPLNMALAGWAPLARSGDPDVMRHFGIRFVPRMHWVQVKAQNPATFEAARTYAVGQWLSDSGGIDHTRSWARWLADAFEQGDDLERYAVLHTVHRWLHRSRRPSRGMIASTRLYERFVQYLDLYDKDLEQACVQGTLPRAVRAFLQLRDRHACRRAPLVDAAAWIDGVKPGHGAPFATVRAMLGAMLTSPSPWQRYVPVRNAAELETLYAFVLQVPREIGRPIFEGMALLDSAVLPRHVRGQWIGDAACPHCATTCAGESERPVGVLERFLRVLEANSYVDAAQRYRTPVRPPCDHQSARSREVWIVRRAYEYATPPPPPPPPQR